MNRLGLILTLALMLVMLLPSAEVEANPLVGRWAVRTLLNLVARSLTDAVVDRLDWGQVKENAKRVFKLITDEDVVSHLVEEWGGEGDGGLGAGRTPQENLAHIRSDPTCRKVFEDLTRDTFGANAGRLERAQLWVLFEALREAIDSSEAEGLPPRGYRLSRHVEGLDRAVSDRVEKKRASIRRLFYETALRIERESDFAIIIDDEKLQIKGEERQRLHDFVDGVRKANVSLLSQALAVDIFVEVNHDLIVRAALETDPGYRASIYVTQAVFVYELSDVILRLLDELSNEGGDAIRGLYRREKKELDEVRAAIEARRRSYEAAGGDAVRPPIESWEDALRAIESQWEVVLDEVEEQDDWISDAKKARAGFEDVRRDAQIQVHLLERLVVVRDVLQSLEALRKILRIENLPLIRLDGPAVLELAGVKPIWPTGELRIEGDDELD